MYNVVYAILNKRHIVKEDTYKKTELTQSFVLFKICSIEVHCIFYKIILTVQRITIKRIFSVFSEYNQFKNIMQMPSV
jgi:hypothetical protein